MKLKGYIGSLDEVDEKYRDLYVADGDGFKLDVDGITSHPDVTALSNAHNRTKATLRTRTEELTAAQALVDQLPEDFDRDLYDQAKEKGVGNGTGKLPNEDEVRRDASEAQKRKSEGEWKPKVEKAEKDRDRYKARVEVDAKNAAIDRELDANKITDPAYRRAARALLAGSVKVVENDGEFEVLATDDTLGDIPVAEHVKAWAGTDEGKAFVGARQSAGGGANGDGQGGKAPDSSTNPFKQGPSFNVTEQARLRRENPVLAERLQREAGVS